MTSLPMTATRATLGLRPLAVRRSEWGAEFFAAVRSVIGTGYLNGLSPFDAIAQTIDGRSILNPT